MFKMDLSEIALIAVTRGLLGAGIALLIADKLTTEQRKAAGLTLTAVGVLTTIPLALGVMARRDKE